MYKWIQKLLGHLDYTNLATQICISNPSSLDFWGKIKQKKLLENSQKVELLDY